MHLGVVRIQFGARGLDRELPVDFDLLGAAFGQPGKHLAPQTLNRGDAAVETQSREYREFAFDHIQPRG